MAEILQTVDVKNSLKIPKGLNNTLQKHVDWNYVNYYIHSI